MRSLDRQAAHVVASKEVLSSITLVWDHLRRAQPMEGRVERVNTILELAQRCVDRLVEDRVAVGSTGQGWRRLWHVSRATFGETEIGTRII